MSKQMKLITGIVVLLVIVGLIFGLSWSGKGLSSNPAEKVRFGTFSVAIDYAPYLVAKEKGWLEEALKKDQLGVEYLAPFQSPPPINEALATQHLDVVFTAEVPTIVGRAAGIDVRVAWLSATLSSQVVVSSSSGIRSLADLKGKKVAILSGTSPHAGLVRNLKRQGMSPQSITLVDMPPPEAKAAFEAGSVDAWAIWPPWVEQEVVAGRGHPLAGVTAPVQVVAAVRGGFADRHPQAVTHILGVLDQGKRWVRDHPDEAQQMLSHQLGLPLKVVTLAWPKIDWRATLNSPGVIDDIQAKADFLKGGGFIKQAVQVRQGLIWAGSKAP